MIGHFLDKIPHCCTLVLEDINALSEPRKIPFVQSLLLMVGILIYSGLYSELVPNVTIEEKGVLAVRHMVPPLSDVEGSCIV